MKRVFLCTEVLFPRGGASANYIEYLALALKNEGYNPIVIGQDKKNGSSNGLSEYNGVKYINYPQKPKLSKYNLKKYLNSNKFIGEKIVEYLKMFNLSQDDYIIFYSSNGFTINKVLKYASKQGTMSSMCITEHQRKEQFSNILLYWRYLYTINYSIPRTKSVIPISRHLENYYQEKGCETLLLPIMANPYEYNFSLNLNRSKNIINFIYSGAAFTKDSFDTMIKSFLLLKEEERENVRFHLTGVSIEKLTEYLGNDKYLLNELESTLVIHPWLEYSDLVNLIQEMDFLFIAREINQTTIANFPSKVPEMMCHGVIPLVSKVGDYTEIYLNDDIDSLIFEGCTPEKGVQALRRAISLSEEKRLNMKQEARKTAEEKFYYGVWGEKIVQFIELCREKQYNK